MQLLGESEAPADVTRIVGTPLSEDEVEGLLLRTTGAAVAPEEDDDGDLRISLAGAQEKTALLWHEGRWMRPHGSTPTTHILKLPLGLVGHRQADCSTSVENEWVCMNLLAAYGLPVARTALLTFGRQKVLGVERFDRQLHASGTWLMRLPQEDFCQALGMPSHLRGRQRRGGRGFRTSRPSCGGRCGRRRTFPRC